MPTGRTPDARQSGRELLMAEIEATWPDDLRRRLRTDRGECRVYGIWRNTFRSGLFDFLWPFLDPTRAAVDVGALLGQYTFTLAAWCTRCLCVEPLRQYRFMADVVPPNCVWKTVAAGARPGHGVLHSPVAPDGTIDFGLSSFVRRCGTRAAAARAQETDIRPLDDLVADALNDEPVGFVKIDVEGFELEVISGASALLRRHRPALLIETADVPSVCEAMRRHGYRGLFYFRRRLFDAADFDPAVHDAPEHRWSPERPDAFDPDAIRSDLYFVPVERRLG